MKKFSKRLIYSFIFLSSSLFSGVGVVNANSSAGDVIAQSEFIQRFYSNILSRDADQEGLRYWLNQLQLTSGAQVSFGFFDSNEFLNLQLDDSEFVGILYSTFFGREADDGGRNYWMGKLEGGALKEMIIYGFLESQEFDDLANSFGVTAISEDDEKIFQIKKYVERFYQLVLNREPDIGGFKDWSDQLSAKTKAGGDIAEGFFNSAEFLNRNTIDSEFLDIAYRAFFDREADQGGKSNWLNKLSAGVSRLEVINGFIDSQEFIDLATRFGIDPGGRTVGVVKAICGSENFTVGILNSIQEGMSLEQVNRTIRCVHDGSPLRVAGKVSYHWKTYSPSYRFISVNFDSTGTYAQRSLLGAGPLTGSYGF